MNRRPLRPCKRVGCSNLTREGYCEEHQHVVREKESQRQRYYDKEIRHKRDKKYSDFYNSREWEKFREDVLILYNGIDIYAYYIEKEIVLANTVHHIEELKDNWDKRLDVENMFPMSDGSHKKIHMLYKKDKEGTIRLLRGLLIRFRKEFNIKGI